MADPSLNERRNRQGSLADSEVSSHDKELVEFAVCARGTGRQLG